MDPSYSNDGRQTTPNIKGFFLMIVMELEPILRDYIHKYKYGSENITTYSIIYLYFFYKFLH